MDGLNPTPHEWPCRVVEVEGREPEEKEVSMTEWLTVRGRRVCQEETKTPEERRSADPIPNSFPAEDLRVEGLKWWQVPWW